MKLRPNWLFAMTWVLGLILVQARQAACQVSVPPPGPILVQIHFVGSVKILSEGSLGDLAGLPATKELKDQTLSRLAKAPFELLRRRAAPNSQDYAALFRPLLEDLLSCESYLEICDTGAAIPELTWSIHLREERAQLWKANLASVATAWTAVQSRTVQIEGFTGWELKKHHAPDLMRVLRAADWLVIGLGEERLPQQVATLERIKRTQRPTAPAGDHWLDALMDGPRLAPRFPFFRELNLPILRFTWQGAGEHTQARMVFTLPNDLNWKPASWRLPTNIIRGPIMSFTAAQGFAKWLNQRKERQRYNWVPIPDQLLAWTAADNPLDTRIAAPFANATNLLAELAPQLAGALNTNLHRTSAGAIRWRPKEQEVVWEGVPFIAPFLRAVCDDGDYLLAGLVHGQPRPPATRDLPEQLKGLTNQVYFDWENTAASLGRWRNLSLLLLPLSGKGLMSSEAAGARWLEALGPKLGQTSTQLVLTAPNEFQLVREGRPGLTGLELVALANWLEATNFPWGGYQVPGRKELAH